MERFLFFGAETMVSLIEGVAGIPIGKAARIGVPLVAEHADVFFVHLDRYFWYVNGKRDSLSRQRSRELSYDWGWGIL